MATKHVARDITALTGITDSAAIELIEDDMRARTGGTLDAVTRAQFNRMVWDAVRMFGAWEAGDAATVRAASGMTWDVYCDMAGHGTPAAGVLSGAAGRCIARKAAANRPDPQITKWIDAGLLARYPDGPYAVHAYFAATGRELTYRNHGAADAAQTADDLALRATRVHVSLDTCG